MTTVRLLGTEVADHKSLIGVEFNPKAPICSPGHFAVTLVERSLPLESGLRKKNGFCNCGWQELGVL